MQRPFLTAATLIALAIPLSSAQAQSAAEKILTQRFEIQIELATSGDLQAQLDVATAYQHGSGVTKDMAEAIRWYEAAAGQGSPVAMEQLGSIYHRSVAWDDNSPEAQAAVAKATEWYLRAARLGHAGAQNSLGLIYGFGDRVDADPVRGRMWLFVAEANGHVMQGSLMGRLEERMTADDLDAALQASKVCLDSNYDECG
ncbi:MAG: hypothetical protein GC146_06180 [Limimaricola sp.]|uniref:tetratricopeptide repeat protein n=1 Tax=Limimaricola sp. TaxID=2211665 RepID=UPI001D2B5FAA|nr:tetratricopeptide repeat protein [Limimaricola sp.]MBI1416797.1 hypothetical protein [Limimaricola sp.]